MRIAVVGCALLVTGCGLVTHSTGVQPLGPDTYTVTADDLNYSAARGSALSQAQKYCIGQGKELLVTNQQGGTTSNTRSVTTITFRCLAKGDPELRRPNYQTPPAVRIEDTRKQ